MGIRNFVRRAGDEDLVPIVVEIMYAPHVVVDNCIRGIKDTGLTSIPFR